MNYTDEDIKRGLILNGSEKGVEYGLTSDRFTDDSYLWLDGNTLWISLVVSRREGCGYVRNIIDIAKSKGHTIMCVPVSSRMVGILEKNGFIQQGEYYVYGIEDKR